MLMANSNPLFDTNPTTIGKVGSNMFGAIANNYFGWDTFVQQTEDFGLDDIRFPGGAVSEKGVIRDGVIVLLDHELQLDDLTGDRGDIAFDLTHPELISPLALARDAALGGANRVASFSDVLQVAVERDANVGIVIPISRYYSPDFFFQHTGFNEADVRHRAITAAKEDISVFLQRLKAGDFNDGVYPPSLRFEIGNEQYKRPIEYAVIAKAMLEQIELEMRGSDIDYSVALQPGKGTLDFGRLVGNKYFDPFLEDDADVIPGLENLEAMLVVEEQDRDTKATKISEIILSVLGDSLIHSDAIRPHILGFNSDRLENFYNHMHHLDDIRDFWLDAYNELGVDPDSIEYYVSAWSTNSGNDDDGQAFGLAGASNMLEIFSYFAEQEVDSAAVWGIIGVFDYKPKSRDTVISDMKSGIMSPQAAVIKLMSDNIRNADYLDIGQELAFNDSRNDDYRIYTYETDEAYTIFITVEDLKDHSLTVNLNLGAIDSAKFARVTNLDIENGETGGQARLEESVESLLDGTVSVSFDQDYEIVMVNIPRSGTLGDFDDLFDLGLLNAEVVSSLNFGIRQGTEANDTIEGGAVANMMFGFAGDDALIGSFGVPSLVATRDATGLFNRPGANGGDFIFGGEGDDSLVGRRGNDWLSGDAGNDELWGGSGFDTFVFTAGNDKVKDFDYGVDRVLIDASLFGRVEDVGLELHEMADLRSGQIEIIFDDQNSLTIYEELTIDQLIDSIEIL